MCTAVLWAWHARVLDTARQVPVPVQVLSASPPPVLESALEARCQLLSVLHEASLTTGPALKNREALFSSGLKVGSTHCTDTAQAHVIQMPQAGTRIHLCLLVWAIAVGRAHLTWPVQPGGRPIQACYSGWAAERLPKPDTYTSCTGQLHPSALADLALHHCAVKFLAFGLDWSADTRFMVYHT